MQHNEVRPASKCCTNAALQLHSVRRKFPAGEKTMRRVTINFPDKAFEQLEKNAEKKGVSLAHYLRELVKIGRQVEEATQKQPDVLSQGNPEKLSKAVDADLWKHNLLWTLEARYLLRYLVDSLNHQPAEKREAVLSTATEKAKTLVEELMAEKP